MALDIPGLIKVFEPDFGKPRIPLVIDVPHSGRTYPADFAYSCPFPMLRQTEDAYVDELVVGAVDMGATVIVAQFPRAYIDVNRAEDDIDPMVIDGQWSKPLRPTERTLHGLGLVRRMCKAGVPMYQKPLPMAEVETRLNQFYRPYHRVLERTLRNLSKQAGHVWLINAHSMPSSWPTAEGGAQRRPDFVVGDRDGQSCDPAFTRSCAHVLRDLGYSVDVNDPYKGVEILRRHGRPHEGFHALQLEISRALYLDEDKVARTANFPKLQNRMREFFTKLIGELLREPMPERLAAE
ncbi:MAG: N-formylglutamate amidohydrolase [Alphaproteobacteria bacterium]|nr:N-formylglutamate amidohydrolase [Alphaproteobacteria bacterium]